MTVRSGPPAAGSTVIAGTPARSVLRRVTPSSAGLSESQQQVIDLRCSARLMGGRLRRVSHGAFGLQVLVEAELAPLATVTALLVAAKRRTQVEGVVDRHRARADPAGHGTGRVEVGRRDVAGQTVSGVVGNLDRFIMSS